MRRRRRRGIRITICTGISKCHPAQSDGGVLTRDSFRVYGKKPAVLEA
jgi:hypothetical protein